MDGSPDQAEDFGIAIRSIDAEKREMQFRVTEMDVFPLIGFEPAKDVMFTSWGTRL